MTTQEQIIAQTAHHFNADFSTIYIHLTDARGQPQSLRIRSTQFGIHIESGNLAAPLTLTTTGVNQIIVEP